MAKLIIYRGDAIDREIDLAERSAKIGRGDQNDIVLPDPGKSVSRFHAEIRFEQGRFTIVDLNSQNGTWVAGRRVQQAVLEPGVPAVLGTYRIVLTQEAPPPHAEEPEATLVIPSPPARAAATPPAATPPADAATAATMVGTALPEPRTAAASLPSQSVPPAAAATPKPVPPAPAPPKPAPVPPPVSARPATARAAKKGLPKGLLIGGLGVLLLAAMGAAIFLTPLRNQVPGLSGTPASAPAEAPPAATPPPAASQETPPPDAPAATPPADAATAPAAASPEPQPAAAARPVDAAQAPATPITAAPASRPAPPAAKPAASAPPKTAPPAAGRRGREPAPAKPVNLAQALEDARSAMAKGDYLAAIAGFESILKVDPKYPNAADLLGVARGGAKNASQLSVDAGNKAEAGGDYATAAKQYDRALQLDPESASASEAIRRMKVRMQGEGEDAFKRARQYDALGRGKDAIPMYEKAIQLLPPDHSSVAVAKERLAALKGGF